MCQLAYQQSIPRARATAPLHSLRLSQTTSAQAEKGKKDEPKKKKKKKAQDLTFRMRHNFRTSGHFSNHINYYSKYLGHLQYSYLSMVSVLLVHIGYICNIIIKQFLLGPLANTQSRSFADIS